MHGNGIRQSRMREPHKLLISISCWSIPRAKAFFDPQSGQRFRVTSAHDEDLLLKAPGSPPVKTRILTFPYTRWSDYVC